MRVSLHLQKQQLDEVRKARDKLALEVSDSIKIIANQRVMIQEGRNTTPT